MFNGFSIEISLNKFNKKCYDNAYAWPLRVTRSIEIHMFNGFRF